jgi:predicted esterase
MENNPFTTERDFSSGKIELNPKGAHETTLIFLHGLGDSSEGFYDLFAGWSQHKLTPQTCRIVLPTAPKKPVSCNNGYVMTSWFDIYSLSSNVPATLAEIKKEFSQ